MVIMNKEFKISKNITTVLMALLILGLATGVASAALDLGTAGNFTIFGQSSAGITADTPDGTIITGNIGTSYVGAAIPQISCTEVSGNIYILSTASYSGGHDANVSCRIVSDTIVPNAVADMGTAFTYYSGNSVPNYAARVNELGAGTLTGLTLAPGVYKWTTPVTITGDITLDGTDNTNGTQWIFQVGDDATDTFTVQTGKKIILTNGADPENIVWTTKGQATLQSAQFNGTILGDTGITINSGTVVKGRILAKTLASLTGTANTVIASSVSAYRVNLTNISALAATTTAGTNAIYLLRLQNNGTSTDTYTLTVDNPNSASTAVLNISTTVALDAGATRYLTLSVTNNAAGTFKVNVTAKSGNDLTRFGYINTTTTVTAASTPPTPTQFMVSSTIPANHSTGVAINSAMSATFSEWATGSTVNTNSFTLKQGTTPVSGTVTYSGVTAVFTPASNLSFNTTYTATITTSVENLIGNHLAANKVWTFTTGVNPDTTPPMITATIHANGSTGVPINTKIAATFSEAMNPLTINSTTFTFKNGSTAVPGNVNYSGVTAVFIPDTNLSYTTTYTATITTGAKDLAGNSLASDYVWSWTTGANPDTTPPTVSSTIPANMSTGVAINSAMSAVFSEAMDPLTVTTVTFTLNNGLTYVSGVVTYAGVTATFTPDANLTSSTTYTATITTGAKDLAGNALASDYVWSWTTGATAENIAPTVSSTIPANLSTGVAINSAMAAVFSEAMDPLTVTTVTFTLNGATPVSGTVTYSGVTAVFTPASSLAANTTYTATITTGIKDLAGNALAVNKVWTFTTGNSHQVPVDLGSVDNFAILAKSGISTTGTTSIVGDIGVSPIESTGITGFGLTMDASGEFATSSLVTGKVYAADYAPPTPTKMTTAVLDMQTAYTDAAGRTLPDYTELGAGDIGGLTLTPGLYKWSTGVTIPTDVTLSGGANDIWIFQIAQTLDISNGKQVILSGGAQARNIFWQVAGQTTLGTTSVFNGNILDQKAIVLNTGATLNGRALAQTAVTLDSNTITVQPMLVSSITPNSRNAQIGTPVTIFMSVINYGTSTATDVSITQASGLPVTVSYIQWNGTAFTGSVNTPADIAAGATANYVLTINAISAFTTSSLTFNVSGTNVAAAPISGVNTLTIAASATPYADVIMMSTNMNISAALNNWEDLAVATTNIGANATGVSFNVVVPSSITGLITQVNQTYTNGSIKGPATGMTINSGDQPTFAVFVYPSQAIAFDPTNNRITLQLVDGTGKVIGAQSVAISTP